MAAAAAAPVATQKPALGSETVSVAVGAAASVASASGSGATAVVAASVVAAPVVAASVVAGGSAGASAARTQYVSSSFGQRARKDRESRFEKRQPVLMQK